MKELIELGKPIRRFCPQTLRRSSDNDKTTAIINTADKDRHGTIIEPEGLFLDNFRKNPVVLINHDRSLLTGLADSVELNKKQVVAHQSDDNWDHDDPEIERYFRKVKKGHMRATSIGFIPHKYERVEDGEGNTEAIRITESELVEYSYVTIPSNVSAEITARQFDPELYEKLTTRIDDLRTEIAMLRKTGVRILDSEAENIVKAILERVSPGSPQGAPVHTLAYVPPKQPTTNKQRISEDDITKIVSRIMNKKLGKL